MGLEVCTKRCVWELLADTEDGSSNMRHPHDMSSAFLEQSTSGRIQCPPGRTKSFRVVAFLRDIFFNLLWATENCVEVGHLFAPELLLLCTAPIPTRATNVTHAFEFRLQVQPRMSMLRNFTYCMCHSPGGFGVGALVGSTPSDTSDALFGGYCAAALRGTHPSTPMPRSERSLSYLDKYRIQPCPNGVVALSIPT